MTRIHPTALVCILCAHSVHIYAQSSDTASERARLGDEMIRIEAERRAAEDGQDPEPIDRATSAETSSPVAEATRDAAEPQSAASSQSAAQATVTESGTAAAMTTPAAMAPANQDKGSEDVSQLLQQLRELGELKEAGYLTDEEFDRIKNRILDSQL